MRKVVFAAIFAAGALALGANAMACETCNYAPEPVITEPVIAECTSCGYKPEPAPLPMPPENCDNCG